MKKKLFLTFILILIIIAGSVSAYFYLQKKTKEKEAEQIRILLEKLTDDVNLMEAVKDEMPKELLETHEYLVKQILEGKFKLYGTDPRLKDILMYHGAKTQSIYINPNIELKKELWIPVFYHEVAHNYWHTQNPVETFEEFESQLFNSENYAYTVGSQVWNLAIKHYPIKQEELKTKSEQELFKQYNQETEVYNEMIKGNQKAKEIWIKIIGADIKEQKKHQEILFK